MIQANGLRVGNIYNRKHGKGWTQVVMDENLIGSIFSDSHEHALNDFEGVPITRDILEMIGLKKRFDTTDCNIWDWEDKENKPPTRNNSFTVALIAEGWIYPGAPGAVPFHYVHDLQNLYYFLSHQELPGLIGVNVAIDKSIDKWPFFMNYKEGPNFGKWYYCYKDLRGLNQHSKQFNSYDEAFTDYCELFMTKDVPDDTLNLANAIGLIKSGISDNNDGWSTRATDFLNSLKK